MDIKIKKTLILLKSPMTNGEAMSLIKLFLSKKSLYLIKYILNFFIVLQ
jgi:hypothetical protein